MRYCLHGRKSEKTGCTDESLESLAAQTKARTDPVRSVWAFWVLAAGEEGVTTVYRWYPARLFVVDMIKSETCE